MGQGLGSSRPDCAGIGSRIVVIGCSGAGKSTLARSLAASLDAPWVQLDALYWGPRWTPHPKPDFLDRVDVATRGSRWVVDGNYRAARDIVWRRATTLVWLDYRFPLVFARALRRTVKRGVTGERLFAGNRESLWRSFTSRESILWWVLTSYRRGRREYASLERANAYPGLVWHRLRNPQAAADFMRAPHAGPGSAAIKPAG